jgi:hypothetical protein
MRGITGAADTVDLYLITVQLGSRAIHGISAVGIAPGREPHRS